MKEAMTFSGRVSVVTGAASGIGRALALELGARGSDLAICDVDEEGLRETAARVERLGRKVSSERLDVADREAVHAFAQRTLDTHGGVDAVINNAGVSLTTTISEMSYEDFEWIVGVNFWGVIHGTKAFLPHLVERGDGWIVNVSSVFGIIAFPSQSAYNATKFAVRGFTESLRQELEGTGVTACCVHPGGIRTNIVRLGRFHHTHDGVTEKDTMVAEFDRLARTSPEQAARVIADGMERRAPRVLIGPDAHLIETVQRLLPVRYPRFMQAIAGRMRGRRARS
jgi:NAD(P)-dependent dehydrogenase (short-subunit alcohol dehydrogenase family)